MSRYSRSRAAVSCVLSAVNERLKCGSCQDGSVFSQPSWVDLSHYHPADWLAQSRFAQKMHCVTTITESSLAVTDNLS